MNDELALLRKIADNPYDRTPRVIYADWLDEQSRHEEACRIRTIGQAECPQDGNFMTVCELVGKLLTFPLDVVVLYRACSDWSELQPNEVELVTADKKEIIFREESRYTDYNPRWFQPAQARSWSHGRYEGEQPKFVTVVTLPGN